MAAPIELAAGGLVAEIVNPPDGEVCFLCMSTNGTECIWAEIGDDIIEYARYSVTPLEDQDKMHSPPLTLADLHRSCRFACYQCYIFTISNWSSGMGRIHIPSCIEDNIRHAFLGDGVFVGFQEHNEH